MFEYNSYKYFIAAVDIFSSKLFAEPLKSKTSEETASALKTIISKFGAPITKIESDKGLNESKAKLDLQLKAMLKFN